MIEENAIVVEVRRDHVLVEVERRSSCDSCQAKSGCGTGVLSKVLGKKRSQVLVLRDRELKVGDQVIIGLQEKAMLKGSFAVYFVPLLLMLFFAILGVVLGRQLNVQSPDDLSVILALLGLSLGVVWLKLFSRQIAFDRQYQPVILRVVGC